MDEERVAEQSPQTESPPVVQEDGFFRSKKRRIAAGAVAVFTSASMLVGGVFNQPADLVDNSDWSPQAIVAEDDEDDLTGGGDGGDGGNQSPDAPAPAEEVLVEEEEKKKQAKRIRRAPFGVRLLVLAPLAVGLWALLGGASVLLGGVMSPILAQILSWLLLAALLVGAFALAVKTVFPDLPLKKILNKRSLLGLLLSAVGLGAADVMLPLFWADYSRIGAAVRAIGVLLILSAVTVSLCLRERRRRRRADEEAAQQEEEEPEEEEPQPMTREEILAIADSVSNRRR